MLCENFVYISDWSGTIVNVESAQQGSRRSFESAISNGKCAETDVVTGDDSCNASMVTHQERNPYYETNRQLEYEKNVNDLCYVQMCIKNGLMKV
jgi:hypothetical protein